MESKKHDNQTQQPPEIKYKGLSSEEIIKQEIDAILKLWNPDYILIEH